MNMEQDLLEMLQEDGEVWLTLPSEREAKFAGCQLAARMNVFGHPVNIVRMANTMQVTLR